MEAWKLESCCRIRSLLLTPAAWPEPNRPTTRVSKSRSSSIERSSTVGLKDCPPGANSIRGLTKPGEEFAIVNLSFKVTPAFKETLVKKPVLLDACGKIFNTAMSFIDPGATPEYSCGFAYRVPEGTKLGKIQIDTTTIDLSPFDKK